MTRPLSPSDAICGDTAQPRSEPKVAQRRDAAPQARATRRARRARRVPRGAQRKRLLRRRGGGAARGSHAGRASCLDASGAGHERLANVAVGEHRGRLDVIPVLLGEGINAARAAEAPSAQARVSGLDHAPRRAAPRAACGVATRAGRAHAAATRRHRGAAQPPPGAAAAAMSSSPGSPGTCSSGGAGRVRLPLAALAPLALADALVLRREAGGASAAAQQLAHARAQGLRRAARRAAPAAAAAHLAHGHGGLRARPPPGGRAEKGRCHVASRRRRPGLNPVQLAWTEESRSASRWAAKWSRSCAGTT